MFSITVLLIGAILQGSDGTYSRFLQASRFQPMSISCNNSQHNLPSPSALTQNIPQYGTSQPVIPNSNNYLVPNILNYLPPNQSSEDENDMDIGTRISMTMSSASASAPQKGAVWMPPRLMTPERVASNPNSLIRDDTAQTIMDLENGVRFYLFTRENPVVSQELKVYQKGIENGTHFSASRPTKLIIHGFTEVDAAGEWINVMKEAYLSALDVNVIVADFSSFPLHNLFRTTLPIFASKRLAEFVSFLETDGGASRESFHIIARSSGCHIAGMAGRLLEGRLGRITALEPAAKISMNGATEYKLVNEDAIFVDAIHVNGKRFFFHGTQFGLVPPMGHVDVYPNVAEKGLGCPGENQSLRRYSLRFCHLGRGVRYFTNSIKYPTSYPMCACESFDSYKGGYCSCHQRSYMTYMGERISDQTRGVFQLTPMEQQNSIFRNYRYYSSYL